MCEVAARLDRCLSIRDVADKQSINCETIRLIVKHKLQLPKLCAKLVLKNLTEEQMECQADVCCDWLEATGVRKHSRTWDNLRQVMAFRVRPRNYASKYAMDWCWRKPGCQSCRWKQCLLHFSMKKVWSTKNFCPIKPQWMRSYICTSSDKTWHSLFELQEHIRGELHLCCQKTKSASSLLLNF